jgi:hypothetical protein
MKHVKETIIYFLANHYLQTSGFKEIRYEEHNIDFLN